MITSVQNETIKKIRSLHSKKGREELGLHLIEGIRSVEEALKSDLPVRYALLEEGHEQYAEQIAKRAAQTEIVSRNVMEAVTQTETPQWICVCVETPCTEPPTEYPKGMLVVLDTVQDPGNMGTILRTADALGAAGILLGEGCADPFSPKALRSSMGSVYHIPIWKGELQSELKKLKEAGFVLLCGHLNGKEELPAIKESCALIIGNEGRGASEETAKDCYLYRLSMRGKAESLNASVAAGILMYIVSQQMGNK